MGDVFTFLAVGLTIFGIGPVVISVAVVALIDKVWGYEPDAYERAYGQAR